MCKKTLFHTVVFVTAMSASAMAWAADATMIDFEGIKLSARTGLGYDDNAFRAPRSPYTNYALIAQPQVTPQKKSGFFVPYAAKAEAGKSLSRDAMLLGEASVNGRHYVTSGLSNADEYNIKMDGGPEFILGRNEKSKNSLYAGAIIEKHHQVYFDRANGTARTASNRYNYTSAGAEAKYRHKTGDVDYGVNGKYVYNNFETPVVGSEWSHTYAEVGADVDFPVVAKSRLNVAIAHWVEDYSKRHARDSGGVLSATNPLLVYTYNNLDLTLHNRLSADWRLYLDYNHTRRADGFVNYNDYKENRYGVRVLYEQGRFKTRLALHHWTRNYPNAFAFDNPIGGAKAYSGNNAKFKTEWERSRNSSFWGELVYTAQNTTDLRYDYTRSQIMAGMSWEY